jgi:hypothetical protein
MPLKSVFSFVFFSKKQNGADREQGDRIADFSPIGQSLTLGSFFENYTTSPNFLATFFQKLVPRITFDTNLVGKHSGRFFNQLIWSPCDRHYTAG